MDEQRIQTTFSRREVLTGSAAVIAGMSLMSNTSEAQPDISKFRTKQVRVYVSDEELAAWTIDLVASFAAGLSVIETLGSAGKNTPNEHLQKFSQDAPDMLQSYLLSDLMEMNRHIFTRDYVTTVRFGEIYGELDTALHKWLKDRPKRD